MKTIKGFICYCPAHDAYQFFGYDASKHGSDWIFVMKKEIEFDDSSIVKNQIDSLIAKKEELKLANANLDMRLAALEMTP